MQADCLWYLALVELWAGRWTIATERADEARVIKTQYGLELPPDHLPAALIALHRGQFELARHHSERALSLANRMVLPVHLAVLATIELWTGNPVAGDHWFRTGRRCGRRAWTRRASADVHGAPSTPRPCSGSVASTTQNGLSRDWEGLAARVGRMRVSADAARIRGLIAVARGDLEAATRLLEDAAARHEAAGDRFGWARSQLAIGIVHRRLRRKRLARLALEAAAQTFDELGARELGVRDQGRADATRWPPADRGYEPIRAARRRAGRGRALEP